MNRVQLHAAGEALLIVPLWLVDRAFAAASRRAGPSVSNTVRRMVFAGAPGEMIW
jgi:hypothetical protein